NTKIDDTTQVWFSVGFGIATTNLVEIKRLANEALIFSKARKKLQLILKFFYEYFKLFLNIKDYLIISVTVPAPTVLPPSRIE
ncbi:hypothetical protein, partial [Mesomycoplasma hyorhinis]|uniref:hypothetical protein n=1 Tax=Mesomycoplasma hyorhinis TaxID=2100 RepID=UPI001F1D4115